METGHQIQCAKFVEYPYTAPHIFFVHSSSFLLSPQLQRAVDPDAEIEDMPRPVLAESNLSATLRAPGEFGSKAHLPTWPKSTVPVGHLPIQSRKRNDSDTRFSFRDSFVKTFAHTIPESNSSTSMAMTSRHHLPVKKQKS